ncbi:LysM peptidoglycan-binding domain-containing protein [Roseateles asaccharophilus]|uniref:LysM domain-containing protein n=1 Tax=Roseateles asaccharophilus TaxID=582607 RepID=A0ABU2A888_9BURK|nr:LysM peptidoglycan-binding domain-containing protein [Roseateles asaccharophilus]MDR7333416.1 hypothetical protein [Roseateles asaccharophilus]
MPQALESTSWRPAASRPPTPGAVFAQRGDRPADVAQRYGVDEHALLQANPGLQEDQHLLPGQGIRLPEVEESGLSPAVAGIAGAVGREGLVGVLQGKAYEAGRRAPQQAFSGTVLRSVPTAHEGGVLDHNFGSPGRYNAPGQGMLYTAPDAASVLHEGAAITPLSLTRYDANGHVASTGKAAGLVRAMPADPRAYADGPLAKTAGDRSTPAAGHENPQKKADGPIDRLRQGANGAQQGYTRASSARYGAAGGAAATLIDASLRAGRGEQVAAAEVAGAVAQNTALGAAGAKGVDALAPKLGRFGMVKAGGAVGALVQAGVSGIDNAQAYRAGQTSGARAVANTVVDTGTAAAAGATGAAVGAAVGSIAPVAGTLVGAVMGFGVGVGAHYAIGAIDKATGITSAAKDALASGLQSAGERASKAWNAIKLW